MFSELIGGFFLMLIGIQGLIGSITVNAVLVFAGILFILTGLGHSDELEREEKLHKPGPHNGPVSGPPKDVHPNILCGTGDDNEEEQKED